MYEDRDSLRAKRINEVPKVNSTAEGSRLFQKHKVDLILQGHNHNYQRSYPINYNEITPSDPIIADSNINKLRDPKGQLYIPVGTGGAQPHRLDGKAPFIAFQYEGFGFFELSFTNNGRNVTDIFFATSDRSIKDSFYFN